LLDIDDPDTRLLPAWLEPWSALVDVVRDHTKVELYWDIRLVELGEEKSRVSVDLRTLDTLLHKSIPSQGSAHRVDREPSLSERVLTIDVSYAPNT